MTRCRQRNVPQKLETVSNKAAQQNNSLIVAEDTSRPDESKELSSNYLAMEHSSFTPPSHIISFLFKQLIYSRIFLLFFQCAINFVMKDGTTDAFKGIHQECEDQQNWLINILFSGLSRWDAMHFLHIAEFGYVWESSLAFFPLFPVMLRILGGIVYQLASPAVSFFSAMVISGSALNNTLFVLNGLLLFRLILLLNDGNLKEAILAVYIHCWCPASIFYSALYTESLYFTFTLVGLLQLYSSALNHQNLVVTSAIFSLSFLTRSNGLTNIGFVGFQLFLDGILIRLHNREDGQQQIIEFRECSSDMAKRLARNFLFFLLCFAIMSLPLRVFEFVVRDKFCSLTVSTFLNQHIQEYLQDGAAGREIVLPGNLAKLHWCNDSSISSNLLLPSFYPHIQQKYWDVGLFAYWQWRKLPLFLMAFPTLWLALFGAYKNTFGLLSNDLRPIPEILADKCSQSGFLFACHMVFLAFSGLIFYNVEVSVRLLFSSSPFLYMVIARLISVQTPERHRPEDLMNSPVIPFLRYYMSKGTFPFLLFCYLFAFFIFGTMMHVNWLPFV